MTDEEAMNPWTEHIEKEIELRNDVLNHIEDLKSREYREAVEECLDETESTGNLTLIDISIVKGQRQEEEWVEFDHVYVNQTIDGGMVGDEFAGYIYIPITKNYI